MPFDVSKYPTGMLYNTKTKTYHPILFRYSPPPSGDLPGGSMRFKSAGHHTAGFRTLAEAQADIRARPDVLIEIDAMWHWDGEKTPAMVTWFHPQDLVPKHIQKRPAGLLKHRMSGKYYPVTFVPAMKPIPGNEAMIYKSAGHHEKGFDSLDEATKYINEHPMLVNTEMMWPWDGSEGGALFDIEWKVITDVT